MLSTAEKMREEMAGEYAINQNQSFGTAIGRYPYDKYSGTDMSSGNPWFIGTHAYAEMYYSAANLWQKQGKLAIDDTNHAFFAQLPVKGTVSTQSGRTYAANQPEFHVLLQAIRDEGDSFLARAQFHADRGGALSEQINRDNGYMQGAHDLSWSYASFLTAVKARKAGLASN
jgi:glucoamylase